MDMFNLIPWNQERNEDNVGAIARIDARYRRGVLQVRVPKGERAKGKRIAVKT
jgi:HSP20 family molecular chaperone IbpA